MGGVWIGPNAGGVIFAVIVCVALGYWLSRSGKPRRTPSTLALLWHAFWDRYFPDLRTYLRASRGTTGVSPKETVSPAVSASEREVSAVSEFVSSGETDAETAVADALARLVLAEELDLTIAVKVGCNKKSGEGYQKWSRLIRAAMERQQGEPTPIAQRPTRAKFARE